MAPAPRIWRYLLAIMLAWLCLAPVSRPWLEPDERGADVEVICQVASRRHAAHEMQFSRALDPVALVMPVACPVAPSCTRSPGTPHLTWLVAHDRPARAPPSA
ncbi:MAG: hypothetical protein VKP72_09725 [bacterium]|nr:hypothetical protein [bacterium]